MAAIGADLLPEVGFPYLGIAGSRMPRRVEIEHETKIVRSIYAGDITDYDVLAQFSQINSLPDVEDFNELIDLTEVTSLSLSRSAIETISSTPKSLGKRSVRVMLVSRDAHYGIGRMLETYADLRDQIPFVIMYSREAAMELLKRKQRP